MNLTKDNIEKLVGDLKLDHKIQPFTPEGDLLEQLQKLALDGIEAEDTHKEDQDTIRELRDTLDDINRLSS